MAGDTRLTRGSETRLVRAQPEHLGAQSTVAKRDSVARSKFTFTEQQQGFINEYKDSIRSCILEGHTAYGLTHP